MSENPAAEGAETIVVAESGVGEGGTADPLEYLRSIFPTLGMKIAQSDGMSNAHNLTGMVDFDYIRINDAGSFVKFLN